jgi:hypothetical protein
VADGEGAFEIIYKMFHFVECVGGRVVLPVLILSVDLQHAKLCEARKRLPPLIHARKRKALLTPATLLSTLGFSNQLVA